MSWWKVVKICSNITVYCLLIPILTSIILVTEALCLTFLQYCSFADLLCSHCILRLLLAGWYDGLEVIVAFLKFYKRNSSLEKNKSHFFPKGCELHRHKKALPWWHPSSSARPGCVLVVGGLYMSLYMTPHVCSHCLHHLFKNIHLKKMHINLKYWKHELTN